ncbi:methylated-DNA--[protein]-cysteine S-methyltransferase [Modicisalibacter luteus]|uniref:Methylated-DNA--[protein]-cysteine S-methyltransferase n=1 Tax=Modicisalibacter luteus TaxID=453962 RepID=A0ABV7M7D5_9GAMM|nr:methylated-DNA--[protein]-cysteine S-methyltransferase [Halomonas lutea]GHB00015.1 methylated-DNA--protein-cysteine methyltransferase [Halomonas lutea]
MRYTTFASPLGELLLAGDKRGLRRLCFLDEKPGLTEREQWQRDDESLAEAREEVLAYLAGRRRSFNIDVAPEGSEVQREVWAALMRIPYGQTRTYGELANRLGHGKAVIAVSSASAANPLPILIPCHRLVAARGIGSYSGGVAIKQRLLALECGTAGEQ